MTSCVSCLVSMLLTIIIPLKLTYQSIKSQEKLDTKMWAIYWSFYSLFTGLFWIAPFLAQYLITQTRPPFSFIFVVYLVWLYHDSFKGALVLNQIIHKQVQKIPAIGETVNMIASKVQILKIFEDEKPVQKAKQN